jgi:hypothetical protein
LSGSSGPTNSFPALFRPLHDRFAQAVELFAQQQVPLIHFERRQRKDDLAAWYRARFEGVVFIGIAQEKATSFKPVK